MLFHFQFDNFISLSPKYATFPLNEDIKNQSNEFCQTSIHSYDLNVDDQNIFPCVQNCQQQELLTPTIQLTRLKWIFIVRTFPLFGVIF